MNEFEEIEQLQTRGWVLHSICEDGGKRIYFWKGPTSKGAAPGFVRDMLDLANEFDAELECRAVVSRCEETGEEHVLRYAWYLYSRFDLGGTVRAELLLDPEDEGD